MSIQNAHNEQNEKRHDIEDLPSSHGMNSPAMSPRDVSPQDATAQDARERNITSDDVEERAQALLDEAIESTFPASDPISVPTYEEALAIVKAQKEREAAEGKMRH